MISRKATKLMQCENYGIKIRECNGLTKSKITNELTWRNIFLMRKNFSFFHLHIVEITEQNYTSTVFSQIFCQIDVLLKNDLYCKLNWRKKLAWQFFSKNYVKSFHAICKRVILIVDLTKYFSHYLVKKIDFTEFLWEYMWILWWHGLVDFNAFWFDVIMNSAQLSNKCKFKLLSLHLN